MQYKLCLAESLAISDSVIYYGANKPCLAVSFITGQYELFLITSSVLLCTRSYYRQCQLLRCNTSYVWQRHLLLCNTILGSAICSCAIWSISGEIKSEVVV